MFDHTPPFANDPYITDSYFEDEMLDDFDEEMFYSGSYEGDANDSEETFRYEDYDEFFSDDLEDY